MVKIVAPNPGSASLLSHFQIFTVTCVLNLQRTNPAGHSNFYLMQSKQILGSLSGPIPQGDSVLSSFTGSLWFLQSSKAVSEEIGTCL